MEFLLELLHRIRKFFTDAFLPAVLTVLKAFLRVSGYYFFSVLFASFIGTIFCSFILHHLLLFISSFTFFEYRLLEYTAFSPETIAWISFFSMAVFGSFCFYKCGVADGREKRVFPLTTMISLLAVSLIVLAGVWDMYGVTGVIALKRTVVYMPFTPLIYSSQDYFYSVYVSALIFILTFSILNLAGYLRGRSILKKNTLSK